MTKKTSSASAGTRKKNARKAAKGTPGEQEEDSAPVHKTQQGKNKKLSKAQKRALPKAKRYVPPPKPPAPPIPNPLDSQGLAGQLPAELVVALRGLGKKDDVTRRKALEEFKDVWVGGVKGEQDEVEKEVKEAALVSSTPVWLHNLASLLQSPFHRTMALQLHEELLTIPSIRHIILETLSLSLLPGTQNRDILGAWLVTSLDEGRRSGLDNRKRDESTVWLSSTEELATEDGRINLTAQLPYLVEYLSLSVLDPPSLHDDIHPSAVQAAFQPKTAPKPKKKGYVTPVAAPDVDAEDELVAEERWTRYRLGGFVGLSWLLTQLSTNNIPLPEELLALLRNSYLWTALSPTIGEEGDENLGGRQPVIRRAAYDLLSTLVTRYPEVVKNKETLDMLSSAVLENCWIEREATVWQTAGPAVAHFLGKNKEAWQIAFESQPAVEASTQKDGPDNNGEGGLKEDNEEDDNDDDEDDDDEEEGGDEEDEEVKAKGDSTGGEVQKFTTPATPRSTAYIQFLDFVSSICPTIPDSTYPFLLMFIATIPPSILSLTSPPTLELQTLFSHLWAPADARLLSTHSLPGRLSAYTTFIQHLIDNTGLLMSRAWRSEENRETAFWLAEEQMGKRVWSEGILATGGRSGRRGGEQKGNEIEADFFGKEVAKMENLSPELVERMVSVMREPTLGACFPSAQPGGKASETPLARLQAIAKASGQSPKFKAALVDILTEVTSRAVQEFATTSSAGELGRNEVLVTYLLGVLSSTPEALTEQSRSNLLSTLDSSLGSLLSNTTPISTSVGLISALSSSSEDAQKSNLQNTLWRVLEDSSITLEKRCDFAVGLLSSGQPGSLLKEGVLDNLGVEATQALLNNQSIEVAGSAKIKSFLVACMGPSSQVSAETVQEILALLSTAVTHMVNDVLTGGQLSPSLYPAIEVLHAYAQHDVQTLAQSDIYRPALVSAHHASRIFSHIGLQGHEAARQLSALCEGLTVVTEAYTASLASLLDSTCTVVSPQVVFDVASATVQESTPVSTLTRLLPPHSQLVERMSDLAALSPEEGLSIMDSLIPITASGSSITPSPELFDKQGRSSLARFNDAVLALFRANRESVNDANLLWLVLASSELAKEAQWGITPGCSRGMYADTTDPVYLQSVTREAERALMLCLMKSDTPNWHTLTIAAIKSGVESTVKDTTSLLLARLGQMEEKDDVSCRVFRNVLGHYTRQNDTTPADGEAWLNLATAVSDTQPKFAIAIISAIQPLMQDTPAYEKLQNRWANALLGIKSENASTKGLNTLRLLVATAPDTETSSILLPPHRARFVIQHLASWQDYLYQEEDLDSELFIWIGEAYNIIAPVIQSESGGLWAKIFDFMEDTLEEVTLDARLPLVNTNLRLVQHVISLTSSNKGLLAQWTNQTKVKSSVLELFTQCQAGSPYNPDSTATDETATATATARISAPMDLIHSSILNILPEVGDDAMTEITLPKLANLLNLATPPDIQSAAYGIMRKTIQSDMFALVVECEAWTDKGEPGLPVENVLSPSLLEIVERGRYIEWEQQTDISVVLAQLLSWLAILDHFESASRPLRWAALDQLNPTQVDLTKPKTPSLVEESLMPMLFAMFGVSEVGAWNFPASQYRVDEFLFQFLNAETMADLTPLASFLFYRALVTIPASMRQYYESLKNRQLSLSMLNYVALHYSPIIIANEFASLRQPDAMATLTEEGLNIKIVQGGGATVAGASSSEVIAGYVVDEQPMEIGIRLPAEFPLKGVQIRDLRRAGVPENKWRGWLMSVQQTITSRNGLILEALTVFKKNLSLHFEGVVECSICYSIISLTDRTLPTKPCSRCHNRFHASCLFKWFNSSHSSSCPLCRELF